MYKKYMRQVNMYDIYEKYITIQDIWKNIYIYMIYEKYIINKTYEKHDGMRYMKKI